MAWLRSMFPDGAFDGFDSERLARILTMQGLAVDDVRPAFEPFSGVVLGRVIRTEPHPDADRLTLCMVAAGEGEVAVVCGAPNVEEGAFYGYATVGARLPGGNKIRRARIRGVESQGMLCSAPELGLDELGSEDGIWAVPGVGEADLGRDLRELLALDDEVLEIDLTSNRGDALSHFGVARELQWALRTPCTLPPIEIVESGVPAAERASVAVDDRQGCSRYVGRIVDDITVAPSPAWLQLRLLSVDQRPVNNVVDVTNFVLHDIGQPLHAFDQARLAEGRIVVRPAAAGERFRTLDDQERVLEAGMTMITDGRHAVAIGGVMGGLDSEVTEATRTVFLEGAQFERNGIARTARRLGLVTEASARFSRGVDPVITELAVDRGAALIASAAGGTVAPGRVSDGEAPPPTGRVDLRLSRIVSLVGLSIPRADAERALTSIGFDARPADDRADSDTLTVEVPSWRHDIEREVDLIEEVARLVGYDTIPVTPLPTPVIAPAETADRVAVARLSSVLRGVGFFEARTPSFVGADVLASLNSADDMVEIRNPISRTDRYLRPFVFATLGRAVAYNLKRGSSFAKLFEIGHTFVPAVEPGTAVDERRCLAMAAAGAGRPGHWTEPSETAYDFFDLKGDVAMLLRGAGRSWCAVPGERPYLHPGRQAEVVADDRTTGFIGEIHPAVTDAWGIDARVLVAELELDWLTRPREALDLAPIPRNPAVERDIALVVPDDVPAGEVVKTIDEIGLAHHVGTSVFDRYDGPQVPDGHHSLGIRLTFQAERTLTDDEVDGPMRALIDGLAGDRGWMQR